jgi:dihydrodipicolinate synthase/N-acetylneuraminate lyase
MSRSEREAIGVPPTIRHRRKIHGMSAVLVPYTADGEIDWASFESHLVRTAQAGLVPAVNMDSGYVQLIDDPAKRRVLELAAKLTGGDFVAGAYVKDQPGDTFDLRAYAQAANDISQRGGTPVIFPSYGLNTLDDQDWVAALSDIGATVDRFIGFELGSMFVPYGRIYSVDAFRGLMEITQCIGAKHSSLSRQAEWERLECRDEFRPEFAVLTGNDLAIDMVMYGSDYLLGLSTFAPEAFGFRDHLWETGDPRFYELNDLLQYLGQYAFRNPVPAYRHDAAMFLDLRGWSKSDITPGGVPRRPDADRLVLSDILERLEVLL